MGLYDFTKMPSGLHRAAVSFQRIMDKVLASIQDCNEAYIGDIPPWD